jgi:enoyl-CoA hydratase
MTEGVLKSAYRTLSFEQPRPHVGLLTFNRREAANAVNTPMAHELLHFFTEIGTDPRELRCVVVTGAGEKAFCAGGDLKERNGMTDEAWLAQHALIERTIVAMIECPIPVLAAVNGAAFGGGCEFALAADFIYAASTAKFALTETRLGIIPGAGGTQTLPRAIGTRRALELICTASVFNAEDALAWNLVNRVVPSTYLLQEALATAEAIAANAPLAVKQAKKSIRVGMQTDIHHGLQFAIEAYNQLIGTQDRREGVRAFVEKRQPVFRGK